jgi:hypothetical protein
MAEGAGEDRWSRTALVAMLVANANRDPKTRAFTVDDFNPYTEHAGPSEEAIVVNRETLPAMRAAFGG